MAPRPQINSQKDAAALPAKLLQIIPTCARECVTEAVNTSFVPSKCDNASDADCICSHYSASGYTLGELAFSCLWANCLQPIRDESKNSVFQICSPYTSAVKATHSVLTLTTMGSASSTSTASTPATTTVQTTTSVQSSLATSVSESQISQTASDTFTTTTISPSSSTSATQSATPTQHPEGLSTGQAVGISVASIALAGFLIGLFLFCCCCCRRRRKDKANTPTKKSMKSRHSFDFVDRSLPPSPVRPPARPTAPPQQEWWRYTAGPVHPEISRGADDSRSHRASIVQAVPAVYLSNSSRQAKETQQKPFRIPAPAMGMSENNRRYRPDSAVTVQTVFEEENKPPLERKVLPKPPAIPRPVLLIPKSSTPTSPPTYTDHYTMSPEDASRTGLGLQIPSQTFELPTAKTLKLSPGISKVVQISIPPPPPSSASSYIPAYYTSNDSRTPVVAKWSPGDNFSQPDLMPKPLGPRGVRSSWASATTFESVDPDETTPENEVDKQLSPVSYPKVPRPSNQAIPRSARSTMSPTPGRFNPSIKRSRTLFTKRRGSGEDMSLNLGGGLMIRNVKEDDEQFLLKKTPESPLALKGYGRTMRSPVVGVQKETPHMELKSPLWEPKLTPSRRGDDLFISVELKGR